ncbi:MAG: carbamoyltransferase [Hyphomicrobiales bacterium]|nr:carbamoyltransferase [Hyphomicrobiales bacterium]MCP4997707.1 carbamoyltransferase [Hyphomicrobiales bacterium]
MKKRTYIGLATTFHDPAIAIVDDAGNVLFAEAVERYLQYKRAPNCESAPVMYLPELLKEYVDPDHEIVVATSWGERFSAYLRRVAEEGFFRFDTIRALGQEYTSSLVDAISERALVGDLHYAQDRAGRSVLLMAHRILGHTNVELRRYDHHECHAAYACLTSPFDEASCLVVDGMGESSASAIYRYDGGVLSLKRRFQGRDSIGFFFGLITELCGWDPGKGEEWKVMGLAPYGSENTAIRQQIDRLIKIEDGAISAADKSEINDAVKQLQGIVALQEANIRADLAFEGQRAFERLMHVKLAEAKEEAPSQKLVLAGGCALNSSFNGKIILPDGLFDEVHVPPAPADDGNAVGAALLALGADNTDLPVRKEFHSPYLGKDLSQVSLEQIADRDERIRRLGDGVVRHAAQCLADGKLVGWVQGRAEFGPRSLGNRSILADPRPADAKAQINAKVKYREAFRPFAPSILHEHGQDWFEDYQLSPYMERTLKFREDVRQRVPAVVHEDGTGRLQSVIRDWNPRYHDLISAFHELTGVPLILNTSFNIMGKPILHNAQDALLMFYTTGIDVLVVGDYIAEK